MLHLKPDMASLVDGLGELPEIDLREPPEADRRARRRMLEHDVKPEIEIFDLAMLYNAAQARRARGC